MCYTDPKHVKAMHKPPPKVEVKYDYPEGSASVSSFLPQSARQDADKSRDTLARGGTAKDAFDRLYEYTGNLRAVMPLEEVPKREVPEHIPRPDYANNGTWSGCFRSGCFRLLKRCGSISSSSRQRVQGDADFLNRGFAVQGRSFSEEIAMLNERQGRVLNAEEIESMRKVCKVRRLFPSSLSPLAHGRLHSSAAKCSTSPAQLLSLV